MIKRIQTIKSSLTLRSRLMVDPKIQWPILQRTAFYVSACALYFMVVLYFSESAQIRDESPSRALLRCVDVLACWAPGLFLLIPVIAYDILIFTNRFAGPMYRLQREMRSLIDGDSSHRITLREGDLWPEIADLFNQISDELQILRAIKNEPEVVPTKKLFASGDDQAGDVGNDQTRSVDDNATKPAASVIAEEPAESTVDSEAERDMESEMKAAMEAEANNATEETSEVEEELDIEAEMKAAMEAESQDSNDASDEPDANTDDDLDMEAEMKAAMEAEANNAAEESSEVEGELDMEAEMKVAMDAEMLAASDSDS